MASASAYPSLVHGQSVIKMERRSGDGVERCVLLKTEPSKHASWGRGGRVEGRVGSQNRSLQRQGMPAPTPELIWLSYIYFT